MPRLSDRAKWKPIFFKKKRENGSTIIYQGSLRVDFPIGRIITFALSLLYSSKKTSGICKKSKRKSAAQSDFLIFPFLFKKKKKERKKKSLRTHKKTICRPSMRTIPPPVLIQKEKQNRPLDIQSNTLVSVRFLLR